MIRGASNKIRKMLEHDRARIERAGIVTASSGNHGIACAHVCQQLGIPVTVYSCVGLALAKEQQLLSFESVRVMKSDESGTEFLVLGEAERYARSLELEHGAVFVSPYNDRDNVLGQASIGAELLEQAPDLDVVIVPVGGGGLMSGIALYMKSVKPSICVIGCQPEADSAMYNSVRAGKVVPVNNPQPTLASAVAGDVEDGSITFEICQRFVDEWVLVNEEEIGRAVVDMLCAHKKVIEGAAGLVLAAARKLPRERLSGKRVALLICGGNISIDQLMTLYQKYGREA